MLKYYTDGEVTVIRASHADDCLAVPALIREALQAGRRCTLIAVSPGVLRLAAAVKPHLREISVSYADQTALRTCVEGEATRAATSALRSLLTVPEH